MDMWFELWNTDSGNIVGDFGDQEAALQFVRTSIGSFGPESIASVVLIRESSKIAEPEVIASGDDLVELAWRHRQAS